MGRQVVRACLLPLCLTLCDPMDYSLPGSSVHKDSPGKNTGVGCHFLLQGIFPGERSPRSPALQADSLTPEPPGKPSKVASYTHTLFLNSIQCNTMDCSPWDSPGQNTGVGSIPFSRGSFQPRDQTLVSHIAGRFFTS